MTDKAKKPVSGHPTRKQVTNGRDSLRGLQRYWATAMGAECDPSISNLHAALEAAANRRAQSSRDGDYIREGALKYEAKLEEARWALTTRIIKRVIPGPCEDPRYLEMLARQAASIEFLLERPEPKSKAQKNADALSRILIGTTGEPRSQGYSALEDGMAIILISAGMFDFLYQTSKAVVLSWKPIEPAKGSAVGFSALVADMEQVLNENPYPADLLYNTLAAWLYEGRPRAKDSTAPPIDYQWPLTLLINGAERFVVAHEYGHAFMHQLGVSARGGQMPQAPKGPWSREFQADGFAHFAVAQSSAILDLLPANMALQGAVVAMKAHQILDAAMQIATTGIQATETARVSHPPFSQRIALLEESYLRHHPHPSIAQKDLPGMLFPGQTIDELWRRAKPRLKARFDQGFTIHKIWSMPGP
jgi:hypothetical protein